MRRPARLGAFVPIVTLGPDAWASWGWDHDLYEGHEIAENWSDDPGTAKAELDHYLHSMESARVDSALMRSKACWLFGKDKSAAESWAAQYHIQLNEVTAKKSDKPPGIVVHQSVPPGRPFSENQVITIVFSAGPPMVPIPNVDGKHVNEAVHILERLGFQAAYHRLAGNSKDFEDTLNQLHKLADATQGDNEEQLCLANKCHQHVSQKDQQIGPEVDGIR